MRRLLCVLFLTAGINPAARSEPLPNTKPLMREGDLAAQMVEGIDKYLMRELQDAPKKQKDYWKQDASSVAAYLKSVEPNRQHLRKILGVVDERVPFTDLEYVGGPKTPSLVAETEMYKIHAVCWPVFRGVDGEGLLLEPKGKIVANVIALPDADWTPEMFCGLAPGVPKESYYPLWLVENGCRVIVPVLIDRKDTWSGNEKLGRMTNQPHREFIYRMAYQMGRHIIGYEVQKVLAVVDWSSREKDQLPIGIIGYGEGSRLAYFAAQLDERIRGIVASSDREYAPAGNLWDEPIYRNVWALFPEFIVDDYWRVADLIAPRSIVSDFNKGPIISGPPSPKPGRGGAAPGKLPPSRSYTTIGNRPFPVGENIVIPNTDIETGRPVTIDEFFIKLASLKERLKLRKAETLPMELRKKFDPAVRQHRQFDQLVAFTQKLMRDSEGERAKTFWAKLDYSSPEKYAKSVEPFRKQLWEEVIGKLPEPTLPMNPQSRQIYDEPKWTGYEVTLDLYPDVFAEGILLLPKDLKPGEKRPVVVCQHGLEGTPVKVVDPKKPTQYYNSFGARLADRGYIVFAPQNPYIGQNKFRVLQRKANPLGLSIFSFIIRQHERILDWLATLPNVDPDKIAFYGLSYGGKTAMRVPAILPRYCLSICSGDFNEWTWKNVSVDFRGSYMFSGEYEMPEFNMGHTMVYAEMAALISPRPFMVERGHDDPVGIDEMVAYEYAKVRRHYSRLKIPDKTEIEWFAGGHEIHGQGTFRFLEKHLGFPRP